LSGSVRGNRTSSEGGRHDRQYLTLENRGWGLCRSFQFNKYKLPGRRGGVAKASRGVGEIQRGPAEEAFSGYLKRNRNLLASMPPERTAKLNFPSSIQNSFRKRRLSLGT